MSSQYLKVQRINSVESNYAWEVNMNDATVTVKILN